MFFVCMKLHNHLACLAWIFSFFLLLLMHVDWCIFHRSGLPSFLSDNNWVICLFLSNIVQVLHTATLYYQAAAPPPSSPTLILASITQQLFIEQPPPPPPTSPQEMYTATIYQAALHPIPKNCASITQEQLPSKPSTCPPSISEELTAQVRWADSFFFFFFFFNGAFCSYWNLVACELAV